MPKKLGVFYVFFNYPIIYPVRPVYYCSGHLSNTLSFYDLKYYVGFQNFVSEPLEHFNFVDPQGTSWSSPYRTRKILDYLHFEVVKFNYNQNKCHIVATICGF